MKKIVFVFAIAGLLGSCELDKYPELSYTEHNVDETNDDGSGSQYQTRADIKNQLDAMYNDMRSSMQESGRLDWLLYTEAMSDNAYGVNYEANSETQVEQHRPASNNQNISRDWTNYMNRVNLANQIISNIDAINDPELTDAERRQWKAEALIWRAFNWMAMSYLWGDIPMIEQAPPAITADNVEEVYPLYYPSRVARVDAFHKIAADLYLAIQSAPAITSGDKFRCSNAFGLGLLARLYAEEPIRDYAKVDSCCTAIEAMGLSLVPEFGDLWSWNETKTAMKNAHSEESVFEIPYTKAAGNWLWMMFWRNGTGDDPDESFGWAKWIVPSGNLIAAFDAEGDSKRKEQSIVWDVCTWSFYYDKSSYPFMYKMRCNMSSIILMRLGEIYLLHAEALAHNGDLSGAREYINKVRRRASIAELSALASQEDALNAVLKERRLELAFEGFRWYDLIRFGKAVECVNNLNNPVSSFYDAKKMPIFPIDETGYFMPVPQTEIDNNTNLEQNLGY
jgi:hypothetical protein